MKLDFWNEVYRKISNFKKFLPLENIWKSVKIAESFTKSTYKKDIWFHSGTLKAMPENIMWSGRVSIQNKDFCVKIKII